MLHHLHGCKAASEPSLIWAAIKAEVCILYKFYVALRFDTDSEADRAAQTRHVKVPLSGRK